MKYGLQSIVGALGTLLISGEAHSACVTKLQERIQEALNISSSENAWVQVFEECDLGVWLSSLGDSGKKRYLKAKTSLSLIHQVSIPQPKDATQEERVKIRDEFAFAVSQRVIADHKKSGYCGPVKDALACYSE